MMNSIKKVLGFMLALALIVGMIPTFATNVYADEGKWIYVDGVNGSDSNDGSEGSPVQSWEKAKNLLGCEKGGIYVVGTVEASGEISTKNPTEQVVKRTSDIVMFNVSGEAIFANINVDGEDKEFNSEVVHPNGGSTVYFLGNAKFQRIGYLEDPSANMQDVNNGGVYAGITPGVPDNTTGGMVCSLTQGINIIVDGAEFNNNRGKGIFFAPISGSFDGPSDINLTVVSGSATGNKGFFYHNENFKATNLVTVFDALITNNAAYHVGERYTNYTNRTGAVYICDMGVMNFMSSNSAAIFGNANYDVMQQYDYMQGDNQGVGLHLQDGMLGGGNHNWGGLEAVGQDAIDTDRGEYYGKSASPSDADKAAARAAAKSFFEENDSVVINTNGVLRFVSSNDENPPATPNVPIIHGCDDTPTPEEPKEFEVEISKVEVNGTEELPGAELKIESSDVEGFETISWTSGTETKKFTLKAGTYTLTEVAAPENYELAEPITFVVSADGKVTVDGSEVSLVRMEDPRKEEEKEEEPPEEPEDCEPPTEEPPTTDEPPTEEPPTEEPPTTDEPPTEEPPTNSEPPAETPSTPEVPETPSTAGNPPPQLPSTGRPEQPQNNTPSTPQNNTPSTPQNNPPQLPSTGTPGAPNTGDESNMILWMSLATLAAISSVVIRFVRRER